MKILVVHQYYLLPGAGGGSRFNALAQLWRRRGHDVTVVAGNLDYTTGQVPAGYGGRWLRQETDDGVQVWRCHVPQTYARGYMGRAWAFAGFALSSSAALLRLPKPDVIVASSPPLPALLPAALAAWRWGVPWVFEVRDLWPESAVTTGVLRRTGVVARGLYGLEAWAAHNASAVVVLTPAFADDMTGRGLVPKERITCIPNGADLDAFEPGPRDNALRRDLGWGERTVALYAGAHGRANALHQLVAAAQQLQHRENILLACVGDGSERLALQAQASRLGLRNLAFYGPQPKAHMPQWVQACDVGVAVLQNNPTFRTVYPNKVFDYMACARPVLLGIDGVARQLVCEQAQAGVFAQPEDAQALATALGGLADAPAQRQALGARGRAWVLANATRAAMAERYMALLEQLPGQGHSAARAPVGREAVACMRAEAALPPTQGIR